MAPHWSALDRDVLRLARAGEGEALGKFFDHYLERIFSVVWRFTGSTEEAQDLTQEVFLKVRRGIARLDLGRDPAPWLITVALNVCRDHRRSAEWRRAQRSVPLDPRSDRIELADEDANPERAFAAAEERRRVQEAVLRLPPDQFMSVILHDFEGLPHERVAELAGIEHAAARKRHSRSLSLLRGLLSEGGER